MELEITICLRQEPQYIFLANGGSNMTTKIIKKEHTDIREYICDVCTKRKSCKKKTCRFIPNIVDCRKCREYSVKHRLCLCKGQLITNKNINQDCRGFTAK